jgi:DNA-binding MarR family transcriptional regulator
MEQKSNLLLKDQLCFPIYACSRMVTRMYQPWLEKLNLTYPQYLVLLVLWEDKKLSVSQLGKRLFLNTNTLTPLIKNMKEKKLIIKERSNKDERTVYIQLTQSAIDLKQQAEEIPLGLVEALNMPLEELEQMRTLMWKFLKEFE